jgi:hypothetical protein
MDNEKINELKSLDMYFPKGNKKRGEAMVLCAEAFLLGKDSIKGDKNIKQIMDYAKFVYISKESSREDLLEIIEAQLGFWDELEEYLTAQDDKKKTKQKICEEN